MKPKVFAIDIDGVICITTGSDYNESKPNYKVIKKINALYEKGNKIIIFTARYMGRNKNNVQKANNQGYVSTTKQLKSWGVKYNKLIMGKPSYDIIIDDKAFNYSKDWINKY